jgi:ribosomal-protein-alanine N-acetyltransferase
VVQSISLTEGDVRVRLASKRDARVLQKLMLGNREWLRPWEATNPYGPNSFDMKLQIKLLRQQYRNLSAIPLVIEYDNEVVGQLNVANIVYGSVSSSVIGYWVIPEVAGLGITPTAVALIGDYLFAELKLHRIEIDIRPENLASLRVVEKLGFRFEGTKQRYIHINGAWRDHYVFALTTDELDQPILDRWLNDEVGEMNYPFETKIVKHTEENPDHFGS